MTEQKQEGTRQPFVMTVSEKHDKMLQRHANEIEVAQAQITELENQIMRLGTLKARLVGREDGLVQALMAEEDIDYDEVANYEYKGESRQLTITFKPKPEEKKEEEKKTEEPPAKPLDAASNGKSEEKEEANAN